MLESILLAFIISKVKGYKLKPLFTTWEIYPILIFILMYIGLQITVFFGNYNFIKYSKIFESLYLCSFIFLILKNKLYFSSIIGSIFVFIGTLLNKIVIVVNDGKMPVFPKLSYATGYVTKNSFLNPNDIHILGSGETKLRFLADIIDTGYNIMSLGDICIRVFSFIIILNSIKYINETKYNIFYKV